MINNTLQVSYAGANPETNQSSLALRIRLVQEGLNKNAGYAELGDLSPMWNNAIMGNTAYKYIYDTCPYATLTNGTLIVKLRFFVYPSIIDLPYRLTPGFGTISPGTIITQRRSIDVLLSGAELQLDDVFHGAITQQMPIFNRSGEEIEPTITLAAGMIIASEPCITALRLDGSVSCYVHTLTMKLQKEDEDEKTGARTGFSISNLLNHVTAEWDDENGQAQKTTVAVEIPPCVEKLLEACDEEDEEDLPGESDIIDETLNRLVVYYNTCTGEVIDERVIEPEDENE